MPEHVVFNRLEVLKECGCKGAMAQGGTAAKVVDSLAEGECERAGLEAARDGRRADLARKDRGRTDELVEWCALDERTHRDARHRCPSTNGVEVPNQ